ncbi:ADP-ribose pyrophosphatase YjhB, NUDIX family [Paenibacillus sp. 1_12]|uniref:NUDIX domain-containing protein n=1 Tax=Paenibacillus sp. 1_12 TaxID=1566278 RepID=UPI0008DF9AB5|nr:NUDIX hydrolase [Paenibacillus sp. 1_12]SFL75790.1 ADP-ribose pyrophosphatase YjhB, NUDIX family [Paenibacillus sp. 1_12]
MKRIDVASALIYDDQGHLLVVNNIKGNSSYWSPPGGAVEQGETLEQAVIREVKEETGYDVAITGLSSIREVFFSEAGHHALIVSFFAKITGGEICIQDPDQDITEVRWVDLLTAKQLMPTLFEQLQIDMDDPHASSAFYAFEGTR